LRGFGKVFPPQNARCRGFLPTGGLCLRFRWREWYAKRHEQGSELSVYEFQYNGDFVYRKVFRKFSARLRNIFGFLPFAASLVQGVLVCLPSDLDCSSFTRRFQGSNVSVMKQPPLGAQKSSPFLPSRNVGFSLKSGPFPYTCSRRVGPVRRPKYFINTKLTPTKRLPNPDPHTNPNFYSRHHPTQPSLGTCQC